MADVAVLPPVVSPPKERRSKKNHKRRVVAIRPDGINPAAFEHRHFLPLHPTCNKLIAKRWEDYVRDIHHERLKQAKPTIDDSKPRVFRHLDMRLKKQQMEEERVHEIEKHNNILFHRILHQKIGHTEISDISKIKEYIENRNHIAESHQHFRNRNNEQIFKENLTILQRIEEKAPNYNRLDWHSARFRNLGYLCNIAQYPKHYWDLLIEGKDNYDLVRPRTHHSPRVEAIARRASQVKTAPERLGRELRPKTRGAPISSPLPEADDTTQLASKPTSKPSSLKNLAFSQQESVKSNADSVPHAAEPTESVTRSIKGSFSALQQSSIQSAKGSVSVLQQQSSSMHSLKANTSEIEHFPTHNTKGSIAALHQGSIKGSTSLLITPSKKGSINNLHTSTTSLGKSSKKPSKTFLNDASNYTLSDNRSIKMKEDEESAKAAIVIPDRDDLADLGIVDYNSNGTGEDGGEHEVESRPSSGWSEFADASPDETSESALLDDAVIAAENEEAEFDWAADESEVVSDAVVGTFKENVLDENGYSQDDSLGQILEPAETTTVEETREYAEQPAAFEVEAHESYTEAEADEAAAVMHDQEAASEDVTDAVQFQAQNDAEYEVGPASGDVPNEGKYTREKLSKEVTPSQNDDYEMPADKTSYAPDVVVPTSEKPSQEASDAAEASLKQNNDNETPTTEDLYGTNDLEPSVELSQEPEAVEDLQNVDYEIPPAKGSSAADDLEPSEEPAQLAEVESPNTDAEDSTADVLESILPSQEAEAAVKAPPSQTDDYNTFDESAMNESPSDAVADNAVETIENTAGEGDAGMNEDDAERNEPMRSQQLEESAHTYDDEANYVNDSETFEAGVQAENLNFLEPETNPQPETMEKSTYDEEFEATLQEESKPEEENSNNTNNIAVEAIDSPQQNDVQPEIIATTDDDEVPLGVIYSEKQSEVKEASSETVPQETLDESEDAQFKRPAPLPPIESNGKRPSSSSISGGEILSLSRPMSAKVLGPITTPPRNNSKPPSQPPSRPMSGFVADGSNSKRISLPALVKTLSSPSSRPLSGIRPLLSKPGSNQNIEDIVAAEVALLAGENDYKDDFVEAAANQHASKPQTQENSPSAANLIESDGYIHVKTGSASNLLESEANEVVNNHSQTPAKTRSVAALLNENATHSKKGSGSQTPAKSLSVAHLIESDAQKRSASQTPAQTRSAANLIGSDVKSKKVSKNQTPVKTASIARLIDTLNQKSSSKAQTPAKAGSAANLISSEVKSNAHSKRQTPVKAQSVAQLINFESHKVSAPQTPIKSTSVAKLIDSEVPKNHQVSAVQTPAKSVSTSNLIDGENARSHVVSVSQTPAKANSAANLIDTDVPESSPFVKSESASHLSDTQAKTSTVPQTPAKSASVAHLVDSEDVKPSSQSRTPAKVVSVPHLTNSETHASTSQTPKKANSAANLINQPPIKASKSKLVESETADGVEEFSELLVDEEYVHSHTTLLKSSSKPQLASNLHDADSANKSHASLQEATETKGSLKNSTTLLGEQSKDQSDIRLTEGELTAKAPSTSISRSSSSKAGTPSKQRSARLTQAASQSSLKKGRSGASLADLVPLK
ncbi:UNVERIFIED_CONTAM: hypothetical protein HDU68_008423 [Siphonaria sp. JEL0065]|nr:hypothetical protein HDU68_008423 [Siphonaria sp. JEL0065]